MNGSSLTRILASIILFGMVSLVTCSTALGHGLDESYIWLNPQADHFDGRVEIRLEDLRKFFKMEIPEDYESACKVLLADPSAMHEYVSERFKIKTKDGVEIPYKIVKTGVLDNEYFGHFMQFFFETEKIEVPSQIIVESKLLFDFDKYTRCLLCMSYNKFTGLSHKESFFHDVFNPWVTEREVDFNDVEEVRRGRKYYVWEGIRHIWIGLDHILFLVTLLLASVLVKRRIGGAETKTDGEPADPETATGSEDAAAAMLTGAEGAIKPEYEWVPVEGFRGAFWSIFKIVTVFTVAHSITLCLTALGIIELQSWLVESIIALSIVLVALNNIIPTFRDRTWVILFLFGLFHGMGFASVMQNLPFRMRHLKTLLVCFNIGVEIGQIVIVAAIFPVIFLLRKSKFYKPVILIGGSLIMIAIASYWFVERVMGWG